MVKMKDLRDGQSYGTLLCLECHAHYSADRRDYWNTPSDHVFECCDEPMILVRITTTYEEIIPNVVDAV